MENLEFLHLLICVMFITDNVITIDVSNRIDNNVKEEIVELEFTFDYE